MRPAAGVSCVTRRARVTLTPAGRGQRPGGRVRRGALERAAEQRRQRQRRDDRADHHAEDLPAPFLVDAERERVVERVQRDARIQRARPLVQQAQPEAEGRERQRVADRRGADVDGAEDEPGDDRRRREAAPVAQRAEEEAAEEELLADRREDRDDDHDEHEVERRALDAELVGQRLRLVERDRDFQTRLKTMKPTQTAISSADRRADRRGARRPKSAARGRPPMQRRSSAAPISARSWANVQAMFTPGGGSSIDGAHRAATIAMTMPQHDRDAEAGEQGGGAVHGCQPSRPGSSHGRGAPAGSAAVTTSRHRLGRMGAARGAGAGGRSAAGAGPRRRLAGGRDARHGPARLRGEAPAAPSASAITGTPAGTPAGAPPRATSTARQAGGARARDVGSSESPACSARRRAPAARERERRARRSAGSGFAPRPRPS